MWMVSKHVEPCFISIRAYVIRTDVLRWRPGDEAPDQNVLVQGRAMSDTRPRLQHRHLAYSSASQVLFNSKVHSDLGSWLTLESKE
eukprot:3935479-Rhodomonas_salina.7